MNQGTCMLLLFTCMLVYSFCILVTKVAPTRLMEDHAMYARVVLRKTLTNVVLPLNAIAAEIVAVGPRLSPLYPAHLWHFDQSPGLRDQPLRYSTTASRNRDFWFEHALEREQNICSNQSNTDCQCQCCYKLTAGIKWYWLWSLSRCIGFTLHHWPSWQHISQCWTGFLLTWTAPHWVQGMPLHLQKRKI